MKRLFFFVCLSITIISCRKWKENKVCKRAYICGTWDVESVFLDGVPYDLPKEYENIQYTFKNADNSDGDDYPDWYEIKFSTVSVLVEDFQINDSTISDTTFIYDGMYYVWGEDGGYINLHNMTYIEVYLPSLVKAYPNKNGESWEVISIDNSNLLISNNEYGHEILVRLYKTVDDSKCYCRSKLK